MEGEDGVAEDAAVEGEAAGGREGGKAGFEGVGAEVLHEQEVEVRGVEEQAWNNL